MKRFLPVVACLSLLCLSCSKTGEKTEPVQGPELSVNPGSLNYLSGGGSKTVLLMANADWTCDSDSWISVSPSSGRASGLDQKLTVSVSANFTGSRSGGIKFSLKSGSKSCALSVKQDELKITSIADFIKKDVSPSEWYAIKGTITSIEGYAFGDFYLDDGTGEILVYGLTKSKSSGNDQSFSSLKLTEGNVITIMTLRSEYRGEAQAGGSSQPAYYLCHEEGKVLPHVCSDFKSDYAAASWMELPATSADDGMIYLFRGMQIGSKSFRNNSTYFDPVNLSALWVAYPLTRKTIGYGSRTDTWGLDPLLESTDQAVISQHTYESFTETKVPEGGTYVRGHQLPSADRLACQANVKTFYGTNIVPQLTKVGSGKNEPDFNSGIWSDLENSVRGWAKDEQTDTLYVVTGCITAGSTNKVLDNEGKKVTVPTAFFKAVLRLSDGKYSSNGFFFEHKLYPSDSKYKDYSVPIDELEKKTGIDFFVNLPAAVGAEKAKSIESEDPKGVEWWWD